MIVLFIVAKIWKQTLYPLVMEELDKLCISILQNIFQLLKKDDIVYKYLIEEVFMIYC